MSDEQRTRDVRNKYVPPAIDQRAFNCPRCGALAKQFWYTAHAEPLKKDDTPFILVDTQEDTFDDIEDPARREALKEWARRIATGEPFLEGSRADVDNIVYNLSISSCFNCNGIAVWVHDRLLWPEQGRAVLPNPDLPDDVRRDYEEASTILDLSPRGAAALLRLSVQKLCIFLGGAGKKLDDDIKALVQKGLDVRVQKSLDVVRVIGNNAVHPGQIDLRDDRATAEKLFNLVNLIVEIMISQPKHIEAMYATLPEGARAAIEKRDGPK